MTLDQLLVGLTTEKEGKVAPNSKYNPGYVVDSAQKLSDLEEASLETSEGLKKYSEITGDNISEWDQEDIEYGKKVRTVVGNQFLSMYIDQHFNELIDEMKEEDKLGLSFAYCPQNEMEGSDKAYNTTTKTVRESKKEIGEIEKDPKKYLKTQAAAEDSKIMRYYMALFSDEF